MIKIKLEADFSGAFRKLEQMRKQVEYAKTVTLTRLAQQAAADTQAELPRVLDRPMSFTTRSIRWRPATKASQESQVYIAPVAAAYLQPLIEGGTVKPKRRALIEPANISLDRYGNLQRGALKRLLARKDTFSGRVGGTAGIWQRLKGGRLKLLVKYEPTATKRKLFPFREIVEKSVQRNAASFFARAWRDAVRTAR